MLDTLIDESLTGVRSSPFSSEISIVRREAMAQRIETDFNNAGTIGDRKAGGTALSSADN